MNNVNTKGLMLGMLGFKIIVNTHGEVVNLEVPGQMPDEE